jgi:aryl-alcohol dehydrogenase-like predicted oxidoreductase
MAMGTGIVGTRMTPAARLVLGTAQFGMAYGITNRRGQVSETEAAQILAEACAAGITTVDTAGGYGASEAVLGKCLADFPDIAVITKTPAVAGDAVTAADVDAVRAGLEQSLARLRRPQLGALLLHHGRDLMRPGGERLAQALVTLKSEKLAACIGVSIYDGAELDGVLTHFNPDIVQLPLNLFDQRLIRSGHIARLQAAGIEIHARSPFLQGLLLADAASLHPYFAPFRPHFARYVAFLTKSGLTPLQASLGFALNKSGADRVVTGVAGLNELREILEATRALPEMLPAMTELALDEPALVDPRKWTMVSAAAAIDGAGSKLSRV